jgi:hypothetical protein
MTTLAAPSVGPHEVDVPSLIDEHGMPLPQTEERPSLDSPLFRQRLERVVSAIANNQPDSAVDAFFPQLAYVQVKAIKDAKQDWEKRLLRAFSRNIGEYHKQLGDQAQPLKFVRIEIPDARIKWMKPGTEGNRLGYYRVTRSKLIVENADGQHVGLEVTSLISWRGEWYIVHLNGFD